MKKLLVILLAATMFLTFVACKEEKAEYKLGMGIVLSMDNSYDKSDEKDAKARVDATYAAVVLDKDGKIVAIDLDASETEVSVASGKLLDLDSVGLSTKKELKDKYSMKKYSGIGKEWYEQADAYAKKMIGKTVAEIKALPLNEKGAPSDADLSAECTISVSGFNAAIVAACEDAQAKNFTANKEFKLGLDVELDLSGSSDYNENEGKNATVICHTTFSAAVVDTKGKVISALIDEAEPTIQIDNNGKVASKSYINTKRHLKESYNMLAYGGENCIAEWYVQCKNFTDYVVGMTASDVKAISTNNGTPSNAELSASVTINISGFQKTLVQAIANAQA